MLTWMKISTSTVITFFCTNGKKKLISKFIADGYHQRKVQLRSTLWFSNYVLHLVLPIQFISIILPTSTKIRVWYDKRRTLDRKMHYYYFTVRNQKDFDVPSLRSLTNNKLKQEIATYYHKKTLTGSFPSRKQYSPWPSIVTTFAVPFHCSACFKNLILVAFHLGFTVLYKLASAWR